MRALTLPSSQASQRVPANRCRDELPELFARTRDTTRQSRCHLADPERVFTSDVLPRLS